MVKLNYDEGNIEKFKEFWIKRNPCHENDQGGVDRFWGTAEMVAIEYCNWMLSRRWAAEILRAKD